MRENGYKPYRAILSMSSDAYEQVLNQQAERYRAEQEEDDIKALFKEAIEEAYYETINEFKDVKALEERNDEYMALKIENMRLENERKRLELEAMKQSLNIK